MVTMAIKILMENDLPSSHEYMKIARGKYEYPGTLRKFFKKIVRKINKIE